MYPPRQVPRNLQLTLDEGLVDDHLGRDRAQLRLAPSLYLLSHRLEVSLHPVHADGYRIEEIQRFRVLREDGRKVAMNNMAKLPFELSVQISRTRLKPHRGTGIVEY